MTGFHTSRPRLRMASSWVCHSRQVSGPSRPGGVVPRLRSAPAVKSAIEDCGMAKGEIDAVLTKYPTSSFQSLFSARLSQALGIEPRVTATLDQAGASNIGLIAYAVLCMEAGLCQAAVVTYGDN